MNDITDAIRFRILKRDFFSCVYCGAKASHTVRLVVDHARSRKNGGGNEDDNLVTACEPCNRGKSGDNADHRADPPKKVDSVLLGKFFHLLDARGKIDKQGYVEAVDSNFASVRWFSFLDGSPSGHGMLCVADLVHPKARIYESEREWCLAAHRRMSDNFSRGIFRDEDAWQEHWDAGRKVG